RIDRHLRAVRQERRAGLRRQWTCEGITVELGHVAIQLRLRQRPHPPAGMRHPILDGTAPARRVPPVVLGDELLLRARYCLLWRARNGTADAVPTSSVAPAVRHRHPFPCR